MINFYSKLCKKSFEQPFESQTELEVNLLYRDVNKKINIYKYLHRLARNDDCNFIGHLTNEPETCVAMTGCLGSDDIDFTIMSSHASGSTMFHWSKEGDVRLIEHHLSKPVNIRYYRW